MTFDLDWKAILALFAAPTTIFFAVAWIGKLVADQLVKGRFKASLEEMKTEHARELKTLEIQAKERLATIETRLGEEVTMRAEERAIIRERDERVRDLVAPIAGPTLDAIHGLLRLLENLLREGLHEALTPGYIPPPGWSITHEYVRDNALFSFGRFFAARILLRGRLGDEVFNGHDDRKKFVAQLYATTKPLSEWPRPGVSAAQAPSDVQLFQLEQDAIGALLTKGTADARRILEYAEFLRAKADAPNVHLSTALSRLARFLESSRPNSVGWARLEDFEAKLKELEKECLKILQRDTSTPASAPLSVAAPSTSALLQVGSPDT